MIDVRKGFADYILQLKKYCEDIRGLVKSKDWLEGAYGFLKYAAYPMAKKIDEYRTSEFREKWKDEVSDELEDTKYMVDKIIKSAKIVGKLYKMRDVEPELIEKSEKANQKALQKPAAKAIMIILLLGLGFGSLRVLGTMPVSTTGHSVGLTGYLAIVDFNMIYIITSSMIVLIYILEKAMKKWYL